MTYLITLLISILCSLGFRIRGGMRIPFLDNKKFPLNKWWFAVIFASCATYLTNNNLNYWLVIAIASRMSTQLAGWGEYIGCVLGCGKPEPDRSDFQPDDEFIDNFEIQERNIKIGKINIHIPHFKLTDYPIMFGFVGLMIRGLYLSFIIGLALQNISFMVCGLGMPLCYYLCGLYSRKVKTLEKGGWNWGELVFGFYLGLMLRLFH